jgi:hypothetical protein
VDRDAGRRHPVELGLHGRVAGRDEHTDAHAAL